MTVGNPIMALPSAGSRCPVTPFQCRVYDVVSAIPPGRVATYGGVARAVGCRCCRAVGQALRRNPFAPQVPCHRVIAGDFTLGGFNGRRGGAEPVRKRRLLAAEGVRFDAAGRLDDPQRIWEPVGIIPITSNFKIRHSVFDLCLSEPGTLVTGPKVGSLLKKVNSF